MAMNNTFNQQPLDYLNNKRLNKDLYQSFINTLDSLSWVTRARMIINRRNKYFNR